MITCPFIVTVLGRRGLRDEALFDLRGVTVSLRENVLDLDLWFSLSMFIRALSFCSCRRCSTKIVVYSVH